MIQRGRNGYLFISASKKTVIRSKPIKPVVRLSTSPLVVLRLTATSSVEDIQLFLEEMFGVSIVIVRLRGVTYTRENPTWASAHAKLTNGGRIYLVRKPGNYVAFTYTIPIEDL